MKKARRRYDREFEISVVSELKSGKPWPRFPANPSLPSRWRDELAENPERASFFNGDRCKYEARIAQALEAGRAGSCRE